MNKLLLSVMAMVMLNSCSTVHFVNGPEMDDTVIREKWHHTAINGLIEISPPLDIAYSCDDKQWDTITIEKSFLNSLATFSSSHFSLYSPWSIYYQCRDSID